MNVVKIIQTEILREKYWNLNCCIWFLLLHHHFPLAHGRWYPLIVQISVLSIYLEYSLSSIDQYEHCGLLVSCIPNFFICYQNIRRAVIVLELPCCFHGLWFHGLWFASLFLLYVQFVSSAILILHDANPSSIYNNFNWLFISSIYNDSDDVCNSCQ